MKRILLFLITITILFFIYANITMRQSDATIFKPQLIEIENYIPQRDSINPEVSKADIAWHLDHMLKTVNEISKVLKASNPNDFKSSLNAPRTMSLTFGYIPRGAAQSPEIVRPPEVILTKDIISQLQKAEQNIKVLNSLDENTYFEHPVFGIINKEMAIRFIQVHTNHHLKIIEDILK